MSEDAFSEANSFAAVVRRTAKGSDAAEVLDVSVAEDVLSDASVADVETTSGAVGWMYSVNTCLLSVSMVIFIRFSSDAIISHYLLL